MHLGIQFNPWRPVSEISECAQAAEQVFDHAWMTDGVNSRHCWTLLTVVAARTRMGVGPCVTFPHGHNPLEFATTLATLAELVHPEREVVLGLGTGGNSVRALYEQERTLARTRECLLVVRRLLRGERVHAAEYSTLTPFFGFKATAELQLAVPVRRPIPIIVTGTGPRILRMAGELADGVLCASNFPNHSYAAFASGAFPTVSNLAPLEEGLRARAGQPFRRIYGINVSVSEDGDAARAYARRQAIIIVGQETDENLALVGIDGESLQPARRALEEGLGMDGAAPLVPQQVADALIISGTPADCLPRVEELKQHATRAGFDEFYLGAPLGPRPAEAVRLLARDIAPRI